MGRKIHLRVTAFDGGLACFADNEIMLPDMVLDALEMDETIEARNGTLVQFQFREIWEEPAYDDF